MSGSGIGAIIPGTRPIPASASKRSQGHDRRAMLDGAVLPTLLGLALPTVAVMLAQTGVSVAEAYYVGLLGTDALAGVTGQPSMLVPIGQQSPLDLSVAVRDVATCFAPLPGATVTVFLAL